MSALAGLTVVELLADPTGSCAAHHMAAGGATVIKVEPAAGDPMRGWEPRRSDGFAAAFAELNRGKLSVALSASDGLDAPWLRDLLAAADVAICSLPTVDATFPESLSRNHPRLIVAVTSPFGSAGPLAASYGSELAAQAMSDTMGSLGRIGDPPVREGADVALVNGATFTAQAILAALIEREQTGQGQVVEVNSLGALLSIRNVIWTALSNPDEWWGFHLDSWTRPPEHGYATATGPIFFNLWRGDSEDWDRLLLELGMFDASGDQRFGEYGRQAAGTGRYASELKPVWEQALASRPREEAIQLFHDAHANVVPVHGYDSLFADPHFDFLQMVSPIDGASTPGISLPWGEERAFGTIPQLDEHGAQVRSGLWASR